MWMFDQGLISVQNYVQSVASPGVLMYAGLGAMAMVCYYTYEAITDV